MDSAVKQSSVPIIEARHITRRVDNRCVFEKLSLTISIDDRLAIKGPTGSGKTLLLRSLSLLDALDEGDILWNGSIITNSDVPQFRKQVVYLHQSPALLEGTVEQNLRTVFEFRQNRELSFNRDQICEWLSLLRVNTRLLEADTANLSGGERQIVGLIRALQLQPTTLLLDEPTASLDEGTTKRFEELINGWLSDPPNRAVVWVSHSEEQLSRVCYRAVTLG